MPNNLTLKKNITITMLCIAGLFLILISMRVVDAINLRTRTRTEAIPVVRTLYAKHATRNESIVLPGTVWAWHAAPIYARINGYLKKWFVDIGDKVHAGDLLAVIEAPEVDAQLRQAQADLNVVKAKYKLAKVTKKRWVNLLKTDSVSKQETDEKVAGALALRASVHAAQASRDHLRELVSFERIIAPFSGTISDRTTDIGALINEGSNIGAKPLFQLVQNNPLRVYVKIPENYATRITANLKVNLAFAEHPGKQFPAKLFQTAEAIDPKTRTLLAQFTLANKDGRLLPGSYTQITITIPPNHDAIYLPVNTLIFRDEGLQIATLNKKNQVVLKHISIARDFGTEVEVNFGIHPEEPIIINPSDGIYNGQLVRVVK